MVVVANGVLVLNEIIKKEKKTEQGRGGGGGIRPKPARVET